MKNARKRNELRDKYYLIGLEMEAAGTMNRIAVGVIRGVCDYGENTKIRIGDHMLQQWQRPLPKRFYHRLYQSRSCGPRPQLHRMVSRPSNAVLFFDQRSFVACQHVF